MCAKHLTPWIALVLGAFGSLPENAIAGRQYAPAAKRFMQRDPIYTHVDSGTSQHELCAVIREVNRRLSNYRTPATQHITELETMLSCGTGNRISDNLYGYASDCPLRFVDPSGRVSIVAPDSLDAQSEEEPLDLWSVVHCASGVAGHVFMHDCDKTCTVGVAWEFVEPQIWPGFSESLVNQIVDAYIVCICCRLAELL